MKLIKFFINNLFKSMKFQRKKLFKLLKYVTKLDKYKFML